MAKEKPEAFNPLVWEASVRKERAEFEAKEKREDEMFNEMVALAQAVGCSGYIKNPAARYIEFKTWQEALDFQQLCPEEKHFKVKIIHPPKKDDGVIKQGYQIYPVLENNK